VIVGVISSFSYLVGESTSFAPTTHLGNAINASKVDSIHPADLLHTANVVREGDAKVLSNLQINNQSLDPDNSCEFCTQVIYTPAKERQAAIAYQVDKINLTGSKRIVFFAMGQKGVEQIAFLALGKTIHESSGIVNNFDKNIFPDIEFPIMTQNITLSKYWKRYEISLENADLGKITYPFGFVIMGGNQSASEIFYIKGVTFDNKSAQNPVPTVITTT
jgi:hypothetical protein